MDSDPKIEYLTSVLQIQEELDKILIGSRTIAKGGVEGIRLAADLQPDLILDVIEVLCQLIEIQRQTHLEMLEERLGIIDELEQIRDSLK